VCCRYDGRSKTDQEVVARVEEGEAVAACPEVLGGLSTPRRPAEIVGGDADDVLDGTARVVDDTGLDVTPEYIAGAQRMLAIANAIGARRAMLHDRSPSCGTTARYDGTFTGRLVDGVGVTAALLRRYGVDVSPR
jgi:uncharacterized protein YbbK (DUF523 family)